jgi:hypothetical protein
MLPHFVGSGISCPYQCWQCTAVDLFRPSYYGV